MCVSVHPSILHSDGGMAELEEKTKTLHDAEETLAQERTLRATVEGTLAKERAARATAEQALETSRVSITSLEKDLAELRFSHSTLQQQMVAAHAWDTRGGKAVGMKTVYIRRWSDDINEDMEAVKADHDVFLDDMTDLPTAVSNF